MVFLMIWDAYQDHCEFDCNMYIPLSSLEVSPGSGHDGMYMIAEKFGLDVSDGFFQRATLMYIADPFR